MKHLRSWAIAVGLVATVDLTAYVAAEFGTATNATNATGTTQVNTGCVPYPETNRGNIIINYVDRDGNPIESYVSLTQDVGSTYDTTPYRKDKITINGSDYYLITNRLPNNETGTVQQTDTHVTYFLDVEQGSLVLQFEQHFSFNRTDSPRTLITQYYVAKDIPVGTPVPFPVLTEVVRTFPYVYDNNGNIVGGGTVNVLLIDGQSILEIGTTTDGEQLLTVLEDLMTRNVSTGMNPKTYRYHPGHPNMQFPNHTATIRKDSITFWISVGYGSIPE